VGAACEYLCYTSLWPPARLCRHGCARLRTHGRGSPRPAGQRNRRGARPVGERRHVEIDAFARDSALPVERQMQAELGECRSAPGCFSGVAYAVLHALNHRHRTLAYCTQQHADHSVPLLRRHHEALPHNLKTWSASGTAHVRLPVLQRGRYKGAGGVRVTQLAGWALFCVPGEGTPRAASPCRAYLLRQQDPAP